MKKKFLTVLALLLVVGGLTGCTLLPTKEENKPTTTEEEAFTITESDLALMEKLATYAFEEEYDSLKASDFTEEKKGTIARGLIKGDFTEATGADMIREYQKYFGSDQTIEFQDIICFMDHKSEEEQTLYYFDKEKDQYVYNEKHPGHGGGGVDFYGSKMVFDSIEVEKNTYIYNMKVLFYGTALCHDTGGCDYGKGYKTYEDAKNGTNELLDIDHSKYVVDYYGPPSVEFDQLMEDYKDSLNTYQFIFEKEDDNLIFKEYKKA